MRATKNRSLTTARTRSALLLTLLADAEPVAVPLGDVAERPHVGDTVDVDDAVQVVGLVLDHPREEILGHQADLIALAIETLQPDGGMARNHAAHVGHREAAFPAVLF